MSKVFLLKNQYNQYLDKSGNWVSDDNNRGLFRTEHKDEAINQKVEFSVKNSAVRITIFEAYIKENGAVILAQDNPSSEGSITSGDGEPKRELADSQNDDVFTPGASAVESSVQVHI